MTTVDPILQPIVDSPRFPDYLQRLQEVEAREKEARRQFYDELREDEKAEFINGEKIVQSPATNKHVSVSKRISMLLEVWVREVASGWLGVEKTLICLTRNDYEPNLCYFSQEKARHFEDDTMKHPVPDFVIEILSHSTARRDREIKMEDYARHGIKEYWIIDPTEDAVEKYILPENQQNYHLALKIKEGVIASEVLTGFSVPVRAIFDDQENSAALRSLLQ